MLNNSQQPCPYCGNYNNRGISIDAIVVSDEKILLIKRKGDPYKGYWALPGGHLDFEETVEDCVRREVAEETSLKVISLKYMGIYSSPKRHPRQSVAIAYICKTKGIPIAGDDATDIKFYLLKEIKIKLAFDHNEIINDYLCLYK